ncbi:MAG: hypothetical protein LBC63_02875 [Holophagales bacterium]|jgi:hypothetical protein|nr:hypothetical protein [Holophagales bacterium]
MIFFPPTIIEQEQPKPPQAFRAKYDWGFASPSGEGKGTMAVMVDLSNGKTVIELHALGERLMLLEGDSGSGYRVQIPRNEVDASGFSLASLPIPFLPQLKDADGLAKLLTTGTGPGVKASRKDANGPKQLRWDGKDEKGESCTVWLKRTRFEALRPTAE